MSFRFRSKTAAGFGRLKPTERLAGQFLFQPFKFVVHINFKTVQIRHSEHYGFIGDQKFFRSFSHFQPVFRSEFKYCGVGHVVIAICQLNDQFMLVFGIFRQQTF